MLEFGAPVAQWNRKGRASSVEILLEFTGGLFQDGVIGIVLPVGSGWRVFFTTEVYTKQMRRVGDQKQVADRRLEDGV